MGVLPLSSPPPPHSHLPLNHLPHRPPAPLPCPPHFFSHHTHTSFPPPARWSGPLCPSTGAPCLWRAGPPPAPVRRLLAGGPPYPYPDPPHLSPGCCVRRPPSPLPCALCRSFRRCWSLLVPGLSWWPAPRLGPARVPWPPACVPLLPVSPLLLVAPVAPLPHWAPAPCLAVWCAARLSPGPGRLPSTPLALVNFPCVVCCWFSFCLPPLPDNTLPHHPPPPWPAGPPLAFSRP